MGIYYIFCHTTSQNIFKETENMINKDIECLGKPQKNIGPTTKALPLPHPAKWSHFFRALVVRPLPPLLF